MDRSSTSVSMLESVYKKINPTPLGVGVKGESLKMIKFWVKMYIIADNLHIKFLADFFFNKYNEGIRNKFKKLKEKQI